MVVFQGRIVHRWELTSPIALWVTLLAVLLSLWTPIFAGVLQGRQDFFSLGWSMILGSAFRLGVAVLLVVGLSSGATGMMTGAMVGALVGLGIAAWQIRDFLFMPGLPFDGKSLFRQVMPLIFGFGVCQFMFTSDTMFAKAFFTGNEMAPYVAAGTLSRGLLWMVLPLATVMFPKIVHSTARSEKSNLMGVVLGGTAVLSLCCGLGLWVLGPWVIRLIFTSDYVARTIALIPWYAGSMVPLALANVLINDLMARARFRVVPVIVILAVMYGFALPYVLNHFSHRLETVLLTLGVFNVLLLAAAAWAAFGDRQRGTTEGASSPTERG
jgi:O-antigen/teichoic acid export membrane protein